MQAILKERKIHYAIDTCSLGTILVAASDAGVCAILLGDDPDTVTGELAALFPDARPGGGELVEWARHVVRIVDAPAGALDLPLDIRGTEFQQRVWRALRGVPPGATASYADIASRIGAPKAARAVAAACAANVIAVAIPCHRIVRRDGSASGYRWGAARKRALLAREAA